jgi:chemotaxis protein MotA
LFANLLFNPIALKLERRMEHRVMIMSMVLEGIVLISERRTPAYIRETLNSFIVHHENELQMPESDQRLSLDS